MNISLDNEKYMRRCLELAACGRGNVAPNPMVGAVIVYNGKIIGEGYHRKYGEAHAEVNAIASVVDQSLLKNSTIYVSLEPCSHYGKTPPCADLIIDKKIPNVVIASLDPYPQVAGRGVKKLLEAGVDVRIGVLKDESEKLNKAFMAFQLLKRPYVYLKWAESADGYMDNSRKDSSVAPVLLSDDVAVRRVHKLRSEVSAIMVGTRTALLDNPSLTVRQWGGKSPVRVVIDRANSLPENISLFDGSLKTIVFSEKDIENNSEGVEYVKIDFDNNVINQILDELYNRKLNSLMVEGGAKTLQSFIDEQLWDEMWVENSPLILNQGVKSPATQGILIESKSRNGHLFRTYVRGK